MKYMHFKASCSYAGLANLMELAGVDTEDSKIALEMGLPWLFAKEDDAFVSGPMLQSAKWFDLWLRPRGFALSETAVERDALPARLQKSVPVMLGMKTPFGKHAVVFTGCDGAYHFINPTHEDSGEDTALTLDENSLLNSVEETVYLAQVFPAAPQPVDLRPLLADSVRIMRENVSEIEAFSTVPHSPEEYPAALNPLFRALLLDGVTMLELAGEAGLAEKLRVLQADLMQFMRGNRKGLLADTLPLAALRQATEQYMELIREKER